MTLFPVLRNAISEPSIETFLVLFMLATSLMLVAIAFERAFFLLRVRLSVRGASKIVQIARRGLLSDAYEATTRLTGPTAAIFSAGLSRAMGQVRGDPTRAMLREQKRLGGAMKARTWILATAGALMPFVGLFGTVLGVMASFQAIGETGQGGFAVVSVGISQALIATAVGIAVALEGVILYNVLQSISQKISRELALLIDELLELIITGEDHAVHPGE
ncbi:MAG: biopolymer transport protein ExbB/TolQ [Myxococcota bacterium]|jgi:biopolymer transport protein ExbB/TolQ